MNGREPRLCTLAFIIGSFLLTSGWGQKITSFERKRVQAMLHEIDSDIRKHYYAPGFHGLDWDGKVRETMQAIDQADSAERRRAGRTMRVLNLLLSGNVIEHSFSCLPIWGSYFFLLYSPCLPAPDSGRSKV